MNRMYDPCSSSLVHSADHLCADTFLSSTRSFGKKVLPASRRLGEAQKKMPFSRTDALSMISRSHQWNFLQLGCKPLVKAMSAMLLDTFQLWQFHGAPRFTSKLSTGHGIFGPRIWVCLHIDISIRRSFIL